MEGSSFMTYKPVTRDVAEEQYIWFQQTVKGKRTHNSRLLMAERHTGQDNEIVAADTNSPPQIKQTPITISLQ